MSFSKTKAYNLALSHLLLSRQIENVETDTTNEVRVLNTFWDEALSLTLSELDLDSLSETIQLELLAELSDGPWTYAYKYPANAEFFRRLVSGAVIDTNRTHIAKKVAIYDNQKAIFTNESEASAEYIPKDIELSLLNTSASLAVSYMLAFLSAPLIVGKGAKKLRESMFGSYEIMVSKAQQLDALENYNYDNASDRSEYVAARIS